MSNFYQNPPQLPANTYLADRLLADHLARVLPADVLAKAEPELVQMGKAASGRLLQLAAVAEAQQPEHVPFDPWGRRIDEVVMSPAWTELGQVAAKSGLVATPYEERFGPHARIVHAALCYLYAPSSATYLCPMAMTDAATRTLLTYGDPETFGPVIDRLVSRDPNHAWTSGQWMTEREGGSDVGRSSTVARQDGDCWRLYGTKWFTSAVTSDVALTLARPEGAPSTGRGLALFFVKTHTADGAWNNIRVNRLKDKLGTKALPTAELELDGTIAIPVGDIADNGIRKIATMLNITRMHNAIAAVGGMRRGLMLARAYSDSREAFTGPIGTLPLHAETLAAIETEIAAGFALTFRVAELCGKTESGTATTDEARLVRILTPLAKLFTGKQAVAVTSEVLETFAGAGYVEDTGLPRLLRDAQVLPLWEGTTNVLALDMLRAMAKDDAAKALIVDFGDRLRRLRAHAALEDSVADATAAGKAVAERLAALTAESSDVVEAGARRLALDLAAVYTASLLLEAADWALQQSSGTDSTPAAVVVARRWIESLHIGPYPDAASVRDARTATWAMSPARGPKL